jgi:hypothetical protein
VPPAPAPARAREGLPPTRPLTAEAKAAVGPPLADRVRDTVEKLLPSDWKKFLRSEVNTPYFWATVGAVALFFVLVSGALLLRASMVSRPTSPIDPVVEKETQDRKKALEDAKKLFSAGKYEQSLALLRQVLARSPANQQARQYAQMAENALAGRAEAERKSAEADRSLESARAALAEKRYDDAIQIADATLVLDGGRVEAQQIKEQATAAIAQKRADEAADLARKKKEEKKTASKRPPTAAPAQRLAEHTVPTPPPTVVVATGPATMKLLFDSPISDGSVIVYVNGERVVQKSFDFSKKAGLFKRVDGTGTVEASFEVKPGPAEVKVWLSGKGLSGAAFTTTTAQLSPGENRVLRIEYAGGQLAARVQ